MTFERVREVLTPRPEIALAIVFGSCATGRARGTSDLDLAVRFEPAANPRGWAFGGIVAELEAELGRRVDLVDIDGVRSAVLAFEIAKGTLVKGDAAELVRFKVRAFRDWREIGPRFRRCARALASKLAQDAEAWR